MKVEVRGQGWKCNGGRGFSVLDCGIFDLPKLVLIRDCEFRQVAGRRVQKETARSNILEGCEIGRADLFSRADCDTAESANSIEVRGGDQ